MSLTQKEVESMSSQSFFYTIKLDKSKRLAKMNAKRMKRAKSLLNMCSNCVHGSPKMSYDERIKCMMCFAQDRKEDELQRTSSEDGSADYRIDSQISVPTVYHTCPKFERKEKFNLKREMRFVGLAEYEFKRLGKLGDVIEHLDLFSRKGKTYDLIKLIEILVNYSMIDLDTVIKVRNKVILIRESRISIFKAKKEINNKDVHTSMLHLRDLVVYLINDTISKRRKLAYTLLEAAPEGSIAASIYYWLPNSIAIWRIKSTDALDYKTLDDEEIFDLNDNTNYRTDEEIPEEDEPITCVGDYTDTQKSKIIFGHLIYEIAADIFGEAEDNEPTADQIKDMIECIKGKVSK